MTAVAEYRSLYVKGKYFFSKCIHQCLCVWSAFHIQGKLSDGKEKIISSQQLVKGYFNCDDIAFV